MSLQDNIARLSIDQYNLLPKTGKPTTDQWTVLSTILKEQNSNLEVVALGTGSKCIGKSKLCPSGTVINDSHAEVMCRRAFLNYLYSELKSSGSQLFNYDKTLTKFEVEPNIKFHFFTTHVPCGDAAIFSKAKSEDVGNALECSECEENPCKKRKLYDIYRTGAKCLQEDFKQDPKGEGESYHTVGLVRTKPGRGDPTASVSCSDKLAKWCHLGIQGALLMHFLKTPIYLSTFVILSEAPFCVKALQRALYGRLGDVHLKSPYKSHVLSVFTVEQHFDYMKNESKVPCPSSIAWWGGSKRESEVAVNGRKQGVTKKDQLKGKNLLKISKIELFRSFIHCKQQFSNWNKIGTYEEAKIWSKGYQENWKILRKNFGVWTRKNPDLLQFTI